VYELKNQLILLMWFKTNHHSTLDFKLSPWFEYCICSFGYFPGVNYNLTPGKYPKEHIQHHSTVCRCLSLWHVHKNFYISIYILVPFSGDSYYGTRNGKCGNKYAIRRDIVRLMYDIKTFNFITILVHDEKINT